MTDKEKIKAIKAELITRKKIHLQDWLKGNGLADKVAADITTQILGFVDSLPEDPVSEVWHDASKERPTKLPIVHIWYHGNRVAGVMTHEDTSLQEELDDINFQPDDKWAYVDDLLNLDNFCNFGKNLKEESVSDELEEAAVEWFNSVKYKSDLSGTPISAFKAGAQWQEQQDSICYEEAFEDGAKWEYEKVITKAIKWLETNQHNFILTEKDIDEFKKAMED